MAYDGIKTCFKCMQPVLIGQIAEGEGEGTAAFLEPQPHELGEWAYVKADERHIHDDLNNHDIYLAVHRDHEFYQALPAGLPLHRLHFMRTPTSHVHNVQSLKEPA